MTRPPTRVLPLSSRHETATRRGEVFELDVGEVKLGDGPDFKPERLYLSGASDWTIRSIVIDDREQLDQDLPGALFAFDARGGARWFDTIRGGSRIRLSAAYEGQEPGHFRAALVGVDVPRVSVVPSCPSLGELTNGPRAFSGPIRFRDKVTGEPVSAVCDGPERVLPGETAWFVARPHCSALRVEHVVVDLACEEWSVEDIRVHGKSQFAAPGSIPGDVFSPDAVDTFINLETVQTAMDFAIQVTYRGTNPRGRFFGATCVCQVAR